VRSSRPSVSASSRPTWNSRCERSATEGQGQPDDDERLEGRRTHIRDEETDRKEGKQQVSVTSDPAREEERRDGKQYKRRIQERVVERTETSDMGPDRADIHAVCVTEPYEPLGAERLLGDAPQDRPACACKYGRARPPKGALRLWKRKPDQQEAERLEKQAQPLVPRTAVAAALAGQKPAEVHDVKQQERGEQKESDTIYSRRTPRRPPSQREQPRSGDRREHGHVLDAAERSAREEFESRQSNKHRNDNRHHHPWDRHEPAHECHKDDQPDKRFELLGVAVRSEPDEEEGK